MSPQCSPVLPPPIVDRVSGKTFIAIPAPHFISTQISGNDSVQTNFVYVETRTPSLNRMFTPERSGVLCSKQPVDNWMDGVRLSYPPPDHSPWTSQVGIEGEGPTEEVSLFTAFDRRRRSTSSSRLSFRSYSSDLPSFTSASTLFRVSLPSICSSMSSEYSVPNFWEAKAAIIQPNASMTTAPTVGERASQHNPRKARSSCTSAVREEKLVTPKFTRKVDDCLTLVDAVIEEPHEAVMTKMDRLEDLDAFLSNGLKKMDSSLRRITLHKEELRAPLLVISTSQAAIPLSLESSADLHRASSIAQRRGRAAPGPLKLDQQSTFAELDYPSMPTAFRGTPVAGVLAFPLPPATNHRPVPTQFTVDQMILSLRAQIRSLEPEPTSQQHMYREEEAMRWLQIELSQEEDAWNGATKGSVVFKSGDSHVRVKSRVRSATESARRLSPSNGPNPRSTKEENSNSRDRASDSISRRGMRRATISTTSDSEKRVRFSIGPPITIPHDILDKDHDASSTTTAVRLHTPPMKRKPPPAIPSPSITSSSGHLSPPPMSFGKRLRSPTISGPPKEPLPPLPKQIKRRASDIAPAPGTLPAEIDGLYRVRASLDGPRSIRKVKHPLRMADLLGAKKRVVDENASLVAGKKMEKAKLRGRVLPFQNMLNRFRA